MSLQLRWRVALFNLSLIFAVSAVIPSVAAAWNLYSFDGRGLYGGWMGAPIVGGYGMSPTSVPAFAWEPQAPLFMSMPWYQPAVPNGYYFSDYPFLPISEYWPVSGYSDDLYSSRSYTSPSSSSFYSWYRMRERLHRYRTLGASGSGSTPDNTSRSSPPDPNQKLTNAETSGAETKASAPPDATTPWRAAPPLHEPKAVSRQAPVPAVQQQGMEARGAEACQNCSGPGVSIGGLGPIHDLVREAGLSEAARGARKIMSVIYQSCAAVNRLFQRGFSLPGYNRNKSCSPANGPLRCLTNFSALKSAHPLTSASPQAQCRDMRQTPAVYHLGTRPAMPSKNGTLEIDVFNQKRNGSGGRLVSMDCSGFVSTALAAAGLRINKGEDGANQFQKYNSHGFLNMGTGRGADSQCLKSVEFASEPVLLSGDIFARTGRPYGHVMMIENTGADPFGLAAIPNVNACRTHVSPARFDFTVIQSTSDLGAKAVTRHKASELSTSIKSEFMQLAQKACLARFGYGGRSELSSRAGGSRVAALVRHQSRDPSCRMSRKPSVVGEECLANCLEVAR